LYNGSQYVEPKPVMKQGKRNYPMVRTTFQEWTKVFNLDEFEIDRTDESLFKSHHTMLSNRQLKTAIDSIDVEIEEKLQRQADDTDKHFFFWNEALKERTKEERKNKKPIYWANSPKKDTAAQTPGSSSPLTPKMPAGKDVKPGGQNSPSSKSTSPQTSGNQNIKPIKPSLSDKIAQEKNANRQGKKAKSSPPGSPAPAGAGSLSTSNKIPGQPLQNTSPRITPAPQAPFKQTINKDLKAYESILQTFPRQNWPELYDKAKTVSRTLHDQAESAQKSLKRTRESKVKHVYEFHMKFSLAVACIIFLFVGAPMGAIVRKGGFGWPLLISIVFFMLFIVIGIFSKNIAERFVIEAIPAAWMNCLVVFPMGLVLTFWAMRDMNLTQVADFFKVKKLRFRR
ncbi:MAG: LptF/LptG family permease, partial [Bacteroidota bacterium]